MDGTDAKPELFCTTHWTVVLDAGGDDSAAALSALEELCQAYWFPLYGYARSIGHDEAASKDLTQGFFAKLIEKNFLGIADRERGRFRWFLLTAFKRYLSNEREREQALKRGGGRKPISIDQAFAEEKYHLEPGHDDTPDRVYEKRWSLTLVDTARARLKEEYVKAGKSEKFSALESHLTGDVTSKPYAQLAESFGTSEGAIKQEMLRLKERYRDLVREEVRKTVALPTEVDDEIAYLMEVLGRA